MAITSYSELKTAVADWTDDGDTLTEFVDTYIDLAEADFNRVLRLREMETTATVSLTDGEGSLPADFLEMRWVNTATNPIYTIQATTPAGLEDFYDTAAGYPNRYAIKGSTLMVRPTADSVSVGYYQKIPALSDAQTTNWLLTREPLLYLHACEKHHAWRIRDMNHYAAAKAAEGELLVRLKGEDTRAKFADGAVRLRGLTP